MVLEVRTGRVGEEHDETVNADTPPASRRETMFETERVRTNQINIGRVSNLVRLRKGTHASTKVSSIP